MNSRDQMLSRIKEARRSVKGRIDRGEILIKGEGSEGQGKISPSERVHIFQEECRLLSGEVYLAQSIDEVSQFLSSIIEEVGARRVIRWDSPLLRRLEIDDLLDSLDVRYLLPPEKGISQGPGGRSSTASEAELGISGADYGLSDTGTLVLRALVGQDRSTSLLPPIHVAIIESERILGDLDELIARLSRGLEERGGLDSCLTLITGPSKTADIELNLVLGVHGPRDLRVIVLIEEPSPLTDFS